LEHVLLEVLSEKSNTFEVHQLYFEREEVVGHRNEEALFEVELVFHNPLRAQTPWLDAQPDEDVVEIRKVDQLVDPDENFTPCVPVCTIHLGNDRWNRFYDRALLNLVRKGL